MGQERGDVTGVYTGMQEVSFLKGRIMGRAQSPSRTDAHTQGQVGGLQHPSPRRHGFLGTLVPAIHHPAKGVFRGYTSGWRTGSQAARATPVKLPVSGDPSHAEAAQSSQLPSLPSTGLPAHPQLGPAPGPGLPWVVKTQSKGTDWRIHLLGKLGGFDLHKSSADCFQVTALVIESHTARP